MLGGKNSKGLLAVYAQAIHSYIKVKDLDGGFICITEFYLHLKINQFFCISKCVGNKYLYLCHSTFFSYPSCCRDFIDIHWHKRPGHVSVPLINCQLKSMELFKKSYYRVLPIRGLIHFPVSDCNIVTDFRDR